MPEVVFAPGDLIEVFTITIQDFTLTEGDTEALERLMNRPNSSPTNATIESGETPIEVLALHGLVMEVESAPALG